MLKACVGTDVIYFNGWVCLSLWSEEGKICIQCYVPSGSDS